MKAPMNQCDKIREMLSLAAAGVLDPGEEQQVAQHLRTCEGCAAELETWERLGRGLRRLPTPQPPAYAIERARTAMQIHLAEIDERRSNRNLMIVLVAFAWLLTVMSWPLARLLTDGMQAWFTPRFADTWYTFAGITVLGWVAGGAAAIALAWHRRQEGRLA